MRAYHHFSLNRSWKHLAVAFAVIVLPLIALFVFSKINDLEFSQALLDLAISGWRLFAAFIIALVLAWVLVVWLVRGKSANPALAVFDVLQSLPTFTILPVAVHFLGENELTIILFLAITIIWPIIFSIVSALKQVERSKREAIAISGIKGWPYIRYYLLPLTAPGMVTGAIIGLGDGWEALIATEIILATPVGLGSFFQGFSDNSLLTLFGVLIFLSVIYTINKFIWLPLLERSHELIEE